MSPKTLIACVTFGGLEFTKLAYQSIRDTTTHEVDFAFIVGKPGDSETINYLQSQPVSMKIHGQNFGFPYSVNDLYDFAWKQNNYNNLILIGNDVVAYPGTVDKLIELAETSEYQVISALQYDVRSLIAEHPEVSSMFHTERLLFEDFTQTPWNSFTGWGGPTEIADMQLFDIQNFCLYKRGAFEAVGYTDANFYPAYFIDNDYAMRLVHSGIKTCTLCNARFFHFWSRTINQVGGGSTHKAFENNRGYYINKWGGMPGKETRVPPVKIDSRDYELSVIEYWRSRI